MKFLSLLQKLQESSGTPRLGESLRKDSAKSNAIDSKSKDAARKRQERAKRVPRDRKSKQELIQEVIAVKTKSGRVQLIFKDSFNKENHQRLSKESLTIEEAQQFIKDPKFEQTRASQLLFGNVKEKESPKKEAKGKKEDKKEGSRGSQKESPKKEKEEKEDKPQKPKAKRMSKEEIFKTMSQMDPNQLASMPLETRQEFFQLLRKPPTNVDFDNVTFEGLSAQYNISPISSLPFNQQVMNALVFLAKMKAGASEQEMQTYGAMAPLATEFTRNAFSTAKKILSQIGDNCIQNLVSSLEMGGQSVNSEGGVDMQCGDYKFKISAGGELALSTTQFDQSNKNFRGLLANALNKTLINPNVIQSDPKASQLLQAAQQEAVQYSNVLLSDENLPLILNDEKLKNELLKMQFTNENGENIGPIVDENMQLNPRASLGNYQNIWNQISKKLLGGSKSTKKSPLKAVIASQILKSVLRGDDIVPPEAAPNHLVTINGVFPMTDEYFNIIATQADIDVMPAKDVINSSNISRYNVSAGETLKKFRTIIEEKENKVSLKDLLINKNAIDVNALIVQNIVNNNDFVFNASLLPGFTPNDLNAVEYNYVRIGKKQIKIPVLNNEKIANQVLEESAILINDCLIEALTNNFVLKSFRKAELLSDAQEALFEFDSALLLESVEDTLPLIEIYRSIMEDIRKDPNKLISFLGFLREEKRDYKKEYRNYHGKPKQRKERAARTAARELLIKKGRVKKGDGKDVDHKRPLRSGGSKSINNLRVRDKSENRSDNGHKKGEKQKKGSWK